MLMSRCVLVINQQTEKCEVSWCMALRSDDRQAEMERVCRVLVLVRVLWLEHGRGGEVVLEVFN